LQLLGARLFGLTCEPRVLLAGSLLWLDCPRLDETEALGKSVADSGCAAGRQLLKGGHHETKRAATWIERVLARDAVALAEIGDKLCVELFFSVRQGIQPELVHGNLLEEALAIRVTGFGLAILKNHVTEERPVFLAGEDDLRVEGFQQVAEFAVVAVVRGAGEEEEIPGATAEFFSKAVVECFFDLGAVFFGGEAVGFVEYYEVPLGGVEEDFPVAFASQALVGLVEFERIERGDHHGEAEGALAVNVVAINFEANTELLFQLLLPLANLAGGADDQTAFELAALE
jgi:hypothetical protein